MASDSFWSRLFRPRIDWQEDACDLYEQSPLFDKVQRKSIRWIVGQMKLCDVRAGERINSDDHDDAGAVLILSGEVSVHINGREVDRMRRGDLFGEVALATDLPHSAQMQAEQDSQVVFFLRSHLQQWLAAMPKEAARLLQNLSKMIAQRLMDKNRMISRQVEQ